MNHVRPWDGLVVRQSLSVFIEYVPIFSIIAYCITVKLIYPQWQGGDIARWITEIKDPEAASKGILLRGRIA